MAVVAFALSVVTEFEAIPPLVDWRPRWGSTHSFAAWLLLGIAIASNHVGLWLGRRQRAVATEVRDGRDN